MSVGRKHLLDVLAIIAVVMLLLSGIGMPVKALNIQANSQNSSSLGGGEVLNASVRVSTKSKSYTFDGGVMGIDVSQWNGTINWSQVAKQPVDFVFIRSNYGVDSDKNFVTNANGAYKSGLKVGAYHFARFKNRSEMQKEAKAFINQLKRVNINYPVILDLEHTTHGLSKSSLTTLANEFMDIVAAEGYSVMLYTYQNYISKYLDVGSIKYKLWLANYVQQPTYSHAIWQYTNTGRLSGISGHVDVNVAYSGVSTKTVSAGTSSASTSTASSGSRSQNDEVDTDPPKSSTAAPATSASNSNSSNSTNSSSGNNPSTQLVELSNGVSVRQDVSVSINKLINERYATNLSEEGISYSSTKTEIVRALQTEVNKQLNGSVAIDGIPTRAVAEQLGTIEFVLNDTNGRITCLLQSELFLTGHYTERITGEYDSSTYAALKAFQAANNLEETGVPDTNTWAALIGAVSMS